MERMIPPSMSELLGGTISDELDQIEIKVGKIGQNSSVQSLALLSQLDTVFDKISALAPGATKRALTTQFDALLSRLRKDAGRFLADAGGANSLKEVRGKINPASERSWWYLDQYLREKRAAFLRKNAITGGVIIIILLILTVVYNRFLAPDPLVAARYGYEQSARDNLLSGDFAKALDEVDQGLTIVPQDPTLLILKGVILDGLGREAEAQATFNAASPKVSKEDFYLLRGQAYILANLTEKALSDSQSAIKENPDSIQGYMLLGQVNEMIGQSRTALDNYEKAYSLADQQKQYELAALVRTRMAMLMQSMNTQITPPAWMLAPTDTPD
jgi:tetratricopeptide (TPR) repeat protein